MTEINVVDVVGPLPDNTCYIVIALKNKSSTFITQSSYADAEMCHGLLETPYMVTPYEFMIDVLTALETKIEFAELQNVAPAIFGKMYLKKAGMDKAMKIVSASPTAILNAALAGKAPIYIADDVKLTMDATIEYHRLKAAMPRLFPLPIIDNSDVLRLLSDFVDKIQFRQASNV